MNVTATALQMKAAGVDSMVAEIDGNTELALITAGGQAGIKWKYVVLATGYGSAWLSNRTAVAESQHLYFGVLQTPVELHTPATIAEQAAFKKYAGFTGVPDFGWSEGWESAGLLIEGLQVAGKNPTRQSFITNLRKVTSWNDNGLLAEPINFEHTTSPGTKLCGYTHRTDRAQFRPHLDQAGVLEPRPGNLITRDEVACALGWRPSSRLCGWRLTSSAGRSSMKPKGSCSGT